MNEYEIKIAGTTFRLRKLKRAEWRKFQAETIAAVASHEGSGAVDASEELVKRACVSHKPEELDAFADDVAAGVFDELANAIRKRETGAGN